MNPLPVSIPALARAARLAFGDSEAVVDGARRVSFEQLDEDRLAVAKAFVAAGIGAGDKVAIWSPNSYEWVACLLGLQSAGAAVVPLNTRYRTLEAAYILDKSRAKVLVIPDGFLGVDYQSLLDGAELEALELVVVIGRDDGYEPGGRGGRHRMSWASFLASGAPVPTPLVDERVAGIGAGDTSDVIFTSGTTGHPKGVVSTHGQSIRVFEEWSRIVGLRAGDRYLLVNPMFHTFGYKAGILASLLTGATIVPLPAFDAATALRTIAAERITVLPGPPTLYSSLLTHGDLATTDTSSLRLAVTGAAVIPVDLVRRIGDELGFSTVLTAYGLTEATGFVTATRHGDDIETISRTSGRAIAGVEVAIVDLSGTTLPPGQAGEVVVRGYNVMKGYLEDPEQDALAIRNGWLHTGDIGSLDEAGNLSITDRLKDMFIVGGFNAYPAEIEQLLLAHPAISQVAVVGVPDDRLGEVGVAFVVPVPGEDLDSGEVIAWARANMANFKVPRRVVPVAGLPMNASGKVVKGELRRLCEPGAPSAGAPSAGAP